MSKRRPILVLLSLGLAGCAGLTGSDPVRVQFAGLEPLPGEGLEWRMLLKLRVQNPNEQPVDFDGASVELDLRGQPFASGVSDARGSVPRFGEAVLTIPVTVSALSVARQAFELVAGRQGAPLDYVLRGKLAGPALGGVHFQSTGQLTWPSTGVP
jgi:hypothetical protein